MVDTSMVLGHIYPYKWNESRTHKQGSSVKHGEVCCLAAGGESMIAAMMSLNKRQKENTCLVWTVSQNIVLKLVSVTHFTDVVCHHND